MGADTWSTTTTWNGCAARSTASATTKQRTYASTACRRPKSVRGSQSPRTCTHGARWPSARSDAAQRNQRRAAGARSTRPAAASRRSSGACRGAPCTTARRGPQPAAPAPHPARASPRRLRRAKAKRVSAAAARATPRCAPRPRSGCTKATRSAAERLARGGIPSAAPARRGHAAASARGCAVTAAGAARFRWPERGESRLRPWTARSLPLPWLRRRPCWRSCAPRVLCFGSAPTRSRLRCTRRCWLKASCSWPRAPRRRRSPALTRCCTRRAPTAGTRRRTSTRSDTGRRARPAAPSCSRRWRRAASCLWTPRGRRQQRQQHTWS